MKPWYHSESSAKKFGGKPDDYLEIHDWFDQTKSHMADVRHRVILHSSFGIFLAEQVFGTYITNSDGKKVMVRDIGEQHVIEDLGRIYSIDEWLKDLPIQDWMVSQKKQGVVKKTVIPLKDEVDTPKDNTPIVPKISPNNPPKVWPMPTTLPMKPIPIPDGTGYPPVDPFKTTPLPTDPYWSRIRD